MKVSNVNEFIFNCFKLEFIIILHPLQAANCCRDYRLVVDKDDMWTGLKGQVKLVIKLLNNLSLAKMIYI